MSPSALKVWLTAPQGSTVVVRAAATGTLETVGQGTAPGGAALLTINVLPGPYSEIAVVPEAGSIVVDVAWE